MMDIIINPERFIKPENIILFLRRASTWAYHEPE